MICLPRAAPDCSPEAKVAPRTHIPHSSAQVQSGPCYLIKHNPGSSGLRCVVEEGSVSDPPAPPKAGKDYV